MTTRIYCAVFGCMNATITHPEMRFFKLPGDIERRLGWIQLIRRDDLKNKPNFSSYRVCEKHFNVEDILQSSNRKCLRKNARPMLMLPNLDGTVPLDGKEDKQTQTDTLVGTENSTQTENHPLDSIVLDTIKTEVDSDDNTLYTEEWAIPQSSQSDASCSNSYLIETNYAEGCPSENGECSNTQTKKRKQFLEFECKQKEVNEENRSEELDTQKLEVKVKPDYCDAFGTYVASLLRSLPKKKALMLQPKIVNMIVSVGVEDQSDNESDSS